MLFSAERRRHHAARGVFPILVAVFALVEHEVLDDRLAIDALAGSAGARDRLMRVAARSVDDIDRTAGHVGDHDGAIGGFTLDRGRPRVSMPFRSGHAGAEIILL